MKTCTCSKCGKFFEQTESEWAKYMAIVLGRDTSAELCYSCALEKLTPNTVPEESDFISALLMSGQMSDEDEKSLRQDMQDREEGRSHFERDEEEDLHLCPECGLDSFLCRCDDEEDNF